MSMNRRSILWATLALLGGASSQASAQSHRDVLVQAPSITRPQRGSLAGSVANLGYGPAELSRGSFSLDSPVNLPAERGQLLADFLPKYSPDNGLSEWGMGWASSLSIRRFRAVGQVNYTNDEFQSPWGELTKGNDTAYYVRGFKGQVRATPSAGSWIVTDEDGTRYVFAVEDAVQRTPGRYEWYLSEVTTLTGERTELDYEVNASGRRFVSELRYAGQTGVFQYKVRVDYESIPAPSVDYRSGAALLLDRRVSTVHAEVLGSDGAFHERWAHDLHYTESPAGVAFYLASAQKRYASGHSEPAQTYGYAMAEDILTQADLLPLPELDAYLTETNGDGIQPDAVSFLDFDQDGATEIELPYNYSLARRTESGWTYQSLSPEPMADALCRRPNSSLNKPRTLIRMRPEETKPNVLAVVHQTSKTGIMICSYEGKPLYQKLSDGLWLPGANTRVVDLDNDFRPDFIKIESGHYSVLRNTSTAQDFKFDVGTQGNLLPAFTPSASWVADMNGDGAGDIVSRFKGGVAVWHNLGNFQFAKDAVIFYFVDRDGHQLQDLSNFEFTFTDVNLDGQTDIVLSRNENLFLFTNRGTAFTELPVLGFSRITESVGYPVAVDLAGKGEELAVMVAGDRAVAVTLSKPESGLLVSVDDGKGGRVHFEYQRARATPGIVRRPPMLTKMVVEATGEQPVEYDYDYLDPVFHTKGQFLLGFGTVRRTSALSVNAVNFHNDDDDRGTVLYSALSDVANPNLFKVSNATLQEATFRGLRLMRPDRVSKGWVDTSGQHVAGASEVRETYTGLCATKVRTETPDGSVLQSTVLSAPSELSSSLHCLSETTEVVATHPGRPELNTTMRWKVERNSKGQPTRVFAFDGTSDIVAQTVAYDTKNRIASVATPGTGSIDVSYDAATGMLSSQTAPTGVVSRVAQQDGLTDAVQQIDTDVGGASHRQYFGFDGLERLNKQWDNLGFDGPDNPAITLQYAYADAVHPASLTATRLVDGQSGASSEVIAIETAAGKSVVNAQRAPSGWVFGDLEVRDRSINRSQTFWRAPVGDDSHPADMAWSALVDVTRTELQAAKTGSAFEHDASTWTMLQLDRESGAPVTRELRTVSAIEGGYLALHTSENGARETVALQDGMGHTVRSVDASGAVTQLSYDVLGRIVEVQLAGGEKQRMRYDAMGRPRRVEHEGVGAIAYYYDPTRALLSRREYLDADGQLVRSVSYTYDAIGRVTDERHELPAGAAVATYHYTYDGGGTVLGQRGQISKVEGPSYVKQEEFNPDGTKRLSVVSIPGFRSVRAETEYFEDGTVAVQTRTVTDGQGTVLETTRRENELDAYGRLERAYANGQELFRIEYDDEGRVGLVHLPDGGTFVLDYDTLTHDPRGYSFLGRDFSLSVDSLLDARGLVARELVDYAFGQAAQETHDLTYTYDARRFLVESKSGGDVAHYGYDASGLLTSINDRAGSRSFAGRSAETTVGNVVYGYDRAGRVVKKGPATLKYGPLGQVEEARVGDRVLTYVYDEKGTRIAKKVNGEFSEATLFGVYIDATQVIDIVRVAGHVVGVLRNGEFHAVPTDARGTPVTADAGSYASPTPYGQRVVHASIARALDFATKGYDADLGMVRMGLRDYDPYLGQFASPDPLFLESIERCAKSPVECVLYGYAGNNPISYVDPTGTTKKKVGQAHQAEPKTTEVVGEGEEIRGGVGPLLANDYVDARFGDRKADEANGTKVVDGMMKLPVLVARDEAHMVPNPLGAKPGVMGAAGIAKDAYKGAPGLLKTAGKALVGSFLEVARLSGVGDVAAHRTEIYRAFAQGFVSALLGTSMKAPEGLTQQFMFSVGQTYANSLKPLEKYQVGVRLIENYRHRTGSLHNVYDPLPATPDYYKSHWNQGAMERGLLYELTKGNRFVD